jgi:hypothetical protein
MRPKRDDDREIGRAIGRSVDGRDRGNVDGGRGDRDRPRAATRPEAVARVLGMMIGGGSAVPMRGVCVMRGVAD